ncbi:hypothetical protein SAY86_002200 [Trapa natans]|uniref:Uncharacterized protein n=1 Tax=Trapa natans TaxID=22666 RepID=A0AAN7LS01_TRANT|nr:hypothetical protein SAY86_002200 [Trapa natans]
MRIAPKLSNFAYKSKQHARTTTSLPPPSFQSSKESNSAWAYRCKNYSNKWEIDSPVHMLMIRFRANKLDIDIVSPDEPTTRRKSHSERPKTSEMKEELTEGVDLGFKQVELGPQGGGIESTADSLNSSIINSNVGPNPGRED